MTRNRRFYDTEQDCIVTEKDLLVAWYDAAMRGEIDMDEQPFEWYIHNCLTAFGGTLERL